MESAGKNRGSEFVITLPLEQPAAARLQTAVLVVGLFDGAIAQYTRENCLAQTSVSTIRTIRG